MAASTEQLFLRFRSTGDPQALGEVFDRTSAPLLSLALHLRGHPADAEDALQATFVTAIERAASWDASRPLLPWLLGILTLHCKKLAERRARRREIELPSGEPIPDPESPLAASERRELVESLRRHVERLPVEQRQVLLLQLEHGLAPAQVAEVLGIPPGTVRMRLHRAIQQLRGLLPGALVATLLAMLPSRGVAAVRMEVLRRAGLTGVALASAGVLGMKKFLFGAFVVAVLVLASGPVWRFLVEGQQPGQARVEPVGSAWPAPADPARSRDDDAVVEAQRREAVVTVPQPLANATGALRIRAIGRADERPVPGLLLSVQPVRHDVEPGFDQDFVLAGADGIVLREGLAVGSYRLGNAAGDETTVAHVIADAVVEVDLPIDTRELTALTVHGIVRCADGRAAGGASIVVGVQHRLLGAVPGGQADGEGRFTVVLADVTMLVGAELAGHAPSPRMFGEAGRMLELWLGGPGATLRGQVVVADGRPLAGALVQVGQPPGGSVGTDAAGRITVFPSPRRVVSDAQGRWEVRDLPAGPLGVHVRAEQHAAWHRYVDLREGETTAVHCALQPGVALHGRVVDQAEQPIVGATVRLGGTSGEVRTSDAEGRFGYRFVEPGPQRLEVTGSGLVTQRVERPAASASEWRIVVARLPKYRLRLVDTEGTPLAHWRVGVAAHDRRHTADADGCVELVVAEGALPQLFLGAPEAIDALQALPWPAEAVPGLLATVVVTTAQMPTGSLVGCVRDRDGRLATGQVELRSAGGAYLYRRQLVAGCFEFSAVPAGDWRVLVHRPGVGEFGGGFAVAGLAAGERRELGDLVLPSDGEVLCRVVLADGSLASGADVFVFDDAEGEHRLRHTDGRSQVWPVGRYRWRVMHDASLWQSGEFEVVAGRPTALSIVLQPGVRRYLEFPLPLPDWGDPATVEFVLRGPDGAIYDQGSFAPRDEFPYRYMPALAQGDWRLELVTDSGLRFAGDFVVESMAPSRTPIRVAVQPTR